MLFPLMLCSRKGHKKMMQASDSNRGPILYDLHAPPRATRQRLFRLLAVFSLVLRGLLLLGLISQAVANAVDATRCPAPGRLVDIGGCQLHINCTGSGGPTVILDAGLGGSSLDWSKVQPDVARFTRVCSYDRTGYGWSQTGPGPRTGRRIVRNCMPCWRRQRSMGRTSWWDIPLAD